jgi:hypothetical protein
VIEMPLKVGVVYCIKTELLSLESRSINEKFVRLALEISNAPEGTRLLLYENLVQARKEIKTLTNL